MPADKPDESEQAPADADAYGRPIERPADGGVEIIDVTGTAGRSFTVLIPHPGGTRRNKPHLRREEE